MSELKLVLSKKLDAEAIRAELSEHLKVSEPKFLFFKAVDPPSVLQLLGDAGAWLPLSAAAAFYLSTLAKRAADATWDGLASLFNSNEVKPLADVSKTLATAADSVDAKVSIVVGLNIPDDHFGTAISIKPGDPEDVGRVLASFIVHVEQISKAMEAEVKAGRTPHGRASIELQHNGSLLVSWMAQDDFSRHELRIPRSALEDADPFKEDKVPQESPEASGLADQEEAPVIATLVAAARAGDQRAIKFLKTRVCDQAWRLDPENDWRQPEVAEILKKRMQDNSER